MGIKLLVKVYLAKAERQERADRLIAMMHAIAYGYR